MSERQLLIQNVLHQVERVIAERMSEERLDDKDNMGLEHTTHDSDKDSSGTSNTSSTSSDSSSSSDSSGSKDAMDWANDISDDDKDEVYATRMSAQGELLQVISDTRVLNPHKVVKASQLHLVLMEFKANDPKRFRRNLRVSPETFDEMVSWMVSVISRVIGRLSARQNTLKGNHTENQQDHGMDSVRRARYGKTAVKTKVD
ncbi:hypothetical protein B0H11DRAFT_2425247 [Mycena galericulata]|nr:hypothetical protein B0H11DRAFT_2425247 [Mycena galericulata]